MAFASCSGETEPSDSASWIRQTSQDSESAPMTTSACFMTNTLLWYCEALRSVGLQAESHRLLAAVLRCSTHQGVLAESMDLKNSEMWGNVPSAASILSLLRVAFRLSRSW